MKENFIESNMRIGSLNSEIDSIDSNLIKSRYHLSLALTELQEIVKALDLDNEKSSLDIDLRLFGDSIHLRFRRELDIAISELKRTSVSVEYFTKNFPSTARVSQIGKGV